MNSLKELLIDELKDVYHAEKQLVKALPKLAKAAQNEDLRSAFEAHLEETEGHVQKLEAVFEALGERPQAKTCKAMQGLIEEGQEILKEHKGNPNLDAALISAAQKVEHYEIASYGCLCQWAETLGEDEALEILREIMGEEEAADEKLTELAESGINEEAAMDEEGEKESETGSGRGKLRASEEERSARR